MGFPCESAKVRLVHSSARMHYHSNTTILQPTKDNNANSLIAFTIVKPEREINNLTRSVKLKFEETLNRDHAFGWPGCCQHTCCLIGQPKCHFKLV